MSTLPQEGEYIWVLSKVISNQGKLFGMSPVINDKWYSVVLPHQSVADTWIKIHGLPEEVLLSQRR